MLGSSVGRERVEISEQEAVNLANRANLLAGKKDYRMIKAPNLIITPPPHASGARQDRSLAKMSKERLAQAQGEMPHNYR